MNNFSNQKRDIRNFSFNEFKDYLKEISEKSFRATQVFEWLYKKGTGSFDEMKNLPGAFIERLKSDFTFLQPIVESKIISKDKTAKFLFKLQDSEKIEAVLIPTSRRVTACVSTQVGCRFGCTFCASGMMGYKRNLDCFEIISQILHMKKFSSTKSLTHIVFMGVGEPFDNYENLIKAIRIINDSHGMQIAARRITISTCGLVSGIKKLQKENIQVELAVSLHASNDTVRNKILPVNRKYPMHELIKSCKEYTGKTKRQVTFEYVLIRDLTCTKKAVEELRCLLKGMNCKLNLIYYNDVSGCSYKLPSKREVEVFRKSLEKNGIHVTLRTPRGQDTEAACGQLRYKRHQN